jgi:hypothetical protein
MTTMQIGLKVISGYAVEVNILNEMIRDLPSYRSQECY